jgi:uncharacterized protein HemY
VVRPRSPVTLTGYSSVDKLCRFGAGPRRVNSPKPTLCRSKCSLLTLGTLALKRGNLSAAEGYYSRALKIYEASFGETHKLSAMIEAHLGDVFSNERQIARAQQFYRKAVKALTERP